MTESYSKIKYQKNLKKIKHLILQTEGSVDQSRNAN